MCSGNNNGLVNLLMYIANEVHKINPSIILSLNLVPEGNDQILEISIKVIDFEDTYKIDDLEDKLSEVYSFEFLDKIVFYMEF